MHAPGTEQARRPIRLAILDDNPFVRQAGGGVRPRAATFHRFAEAVVASGPFAPAIYLVPVATLADGEPASTLGKVDETRLEIRPTEPFEGIAGYLRSMPGIAQRNWPVIRAAIADADLLWIKAPASNAALAALAARRARVPYFTWVAGSARAVVRGQARTGLRALAASGVAAMYDSVTSILERTGPSRRLDDAFFTTSVSAQEVATSRAARGRGAADISESRRALEVAWAGRLTADKGVDDLLAAIAILRGQGHPARLSVVGDGPARAQLVRMAEELGLGTSVRWLGFIGDRATYMRRLRAASIFALPSRAEGVPKVLLDAMAAGLPIVATDVGAVGALLDGGRRGRLVRPADPSALAREIAALAADPAEMKRLSVAGLDFSIGHTIDAQAARLVAWMHTTFPGLPWASGVVGDRP